MKISDGELKKLLADSGKIKAEDLVALEAEAKDSKKSLFEVLNAKKLLTEKELGELYAKSLDLPFIELQGLKIPRELLLKVPERIARKYMAILFGTEDGKMQLAMADPEDFQAADFIEKQTGGELKIYVAAAGDITAALDQYSGNIDSEITKAIKDSSSGDEDKTATEIAAKDLAEDAPIAKTVNIVIEYAVRSRASDIHIEPREGIVQIRFRVDGVLKETMTLPRPLLPAVVSRIKILANLKIDEHRLPQDGRFKFTLGSKQVALRVSTLPVMDGEKVVMRLLDESSKAMTLEELGFEGHGLEVIKKNLKKPHGMTLVTGPTGSGKSTTLYSVLNLMNTPGVNISTVEDPVEYRITGVNQTQVNVKAGMTFANGLRALLRQDPNIIMVGEIRDAETADLAVQAALTGHVVLSTLHTNNAATTLPRLLDMGIEPFLIASTVNTVVGQRLVRRLCEICRVPYVPSEAELTDLRKDFQVDEALKYMQELGKELPKAESKKAEEPAEEGKEPARTKREKVLEPSKDISLSKSILDKIASDPNIINRSAEEAAKAKVVASVVGATKEEHHVTEANKAAAEASKLPPLKAGQFLLYKAGEGCEECGNSGWQGRMGIHEVLEVDEAVSKMIVTHATSDDIQGAAVRAGMLTMQQDGFVKALRGMTAVEEILRVTRE
jgi:type IV pilus assembly protein PilB